MTTLIGVLRTIARSCGFPESIDLHTHLVGYGAEAHGQMLTNLFSSCLGTVFPRIHFSEPMLRLLIDAYGCGYEAPRTGELGKSSMPTHVAWKDFYSDVQRAAETSEDDNDDTPFEPSSSRKDRELKYQTAYNMKV